LAGKTRNNIAALNASTGLATNWNPNADGWVNALVVSGATVYAGVVFQQIGGESRSCMAALDAATGVASSEDWSAGGSVNALTVSGTTLYAGGSFASIGGQPRNYIRSHRRGDGHCNRLEPERELPRQFLGRSRAQRSTLGAGSRASAGRTATASRPWTRRRAWPPLGTRARITPSAP